MKLCVLGQGTGGNAALWFDTYNHLLSDFPEVEKLTYICRTPCTLRADFETVKPYGCGNLPEWLYRFYAPLVSRFGFSACLKWLAVKQSFDVLLLQGNYSPSTNLKLMNQFNCKTILNMYGSDFYRKYLLKELSNQEYDRFGEVVARADYITCNWFTTQHDFLKAFPSSAGKCKTIPWGIDTKWHKPVPKLKGWPDAEKVFLSARGVYDYNNIDIIVEAFCNAFPDRPGYKLFIVNGYGNHKHAIKRAEALVNKYNAHDRVVMRVDRWIPDEELMALYQYADYNFCFGSSDQLTVSIVYALIKKTVNILSPLQNYFDLRDQGYETLQIVPEISVGALEHHLREYLDVDSKKIIADSCRAINDFNMHNTFDAYMDLYKNLLRASP